MSNTPPSATPLPPGNCIEVRPNGALIVTGRVIVDDGPEQDRVRLCRCGLSGDLPYCDSRHKGSDFRDAGCIRGDAEGPPPGTGPLRVQPRKNGPLALTGPVTLVASDGHAALATDRLFLCRCGQSSNKPFCDGTHKRTAFRAEGFEPPRK